MSHERKGLYVFGYARQDKSLRKVNNNGVFFYWIDSWRLLGSISNGFVCSRQGRRFMGYDILRKLQNISQGR